MAAEPVLEQEIASPELKDSALYKPVDANTASVPAKSFSVRVPPPLLILDLNGSLLYRHSTRDGGGWRKTITARPHLDELFEYVLGTQTVEEDGKAKVHRNWEVVLWSSAMGHTVDSMCRELKIHKRAPEKVRSRTGVDGHLSDHLMTLNLNCKSQKTTPVERAVFDIWDRSKLDLNASDFHQKVQTTKDLRKVWNALVWTDSASGKKHEWGPENTVIVDDSPDKISLQPDNLCQIKEFSGDKNDTELLKLVELLKVLRDQPDIPAAIKAAKEATSQNS